MRNCEFESYEMEEEFYSYFEESEEKIVTEKEKNSKRIFKQRNKAAKKNSSRKKEKKISNIFGYYVTKPETRSFLRKKEMKALRKKCNKNADAEYREYISA